MKKFVRVLGIVLVLVVFAGMAYGCSAGVEGGEISSNNNGTTNEVREVRIEEQVLFEQNDVKVTAKEYISDSFMGDGLKLLVENNSSKNLSVSCDAVIVNNYMISDLFSCSVAAGKKANDTLYLSSSALDAAGIANVGQIEIYFRVFDSDTYETVFKADPVTIKTSAYDDMDITPADTGKELFNQDGVRIVGKYVDENSFWGSGVLLYVENKSGRNVGITCDDMSVNGFMVNPLFSSTVYDGKMSIDTITIFSSDLEENDISSIETIELTFHVYDAATYESIADSEVISFSVN